MRLLLLGDVRPTHLKRWAGFFRCRGHDVQLVSLESDPDFTEYERLVSNVPVRSLRYLLARNSVRRVIDRFQPDIVNGHFLPTYGLLAAVSGFRPVAVSLWGSDILVSARKSPLHRARALWSLRRAQLVTSDSEFMTAEARKIGSFEARIVTQPMGIPEEIHEKLGKRKAGDGKDRLTVLSTRRLEQLYRVDLLIDALQLCKDKLGRLDCLVCGDGSERSRIEESSRLHGLEAVSFLGWRGGDECYSLLSSADIYVSCSESDSTSVSLLEAMSAGAFPIVSDIPGNREWITDEDNGLTFPVGDAAALADCLIEAAGNPELRSSAAIRNREIIRSRAVWEQNMSVIEGAFEEIVESAKR